MSTFLGMRNKIQDDLNRTDLTTQVNREINRAIRKYASIPFWFSAQVENFATAINQQSYDSTDGFPDDIRIIDYVRINQSTPTITTSTGAADTYILTPTTAATAYSNGDIYFVEINATNTGASTINISSLGAIDITRPNGVAMQSGELVSGQTYTIVYNTAAGDFYLRAATGTYYEVTPTSISTVLDWNVNNNPGLPLSYALNESKIYFYPTPDQVYLVDIYYQRYYADLSADGDSNDFTTNPEAEELIEMEAEFQLYSNTILDMAQAQRCAQMRDVALKTCRRITNEFLNVKGHIKATTF